MGKPWGLVRVDLLKHDSKYARNCPVRSYSFSEMIKTAGTSCCSDNMDYRHKPSLPYQVYVLTPILKRWAVRLLVPRPHTKTIQGI
jgi:hypothetical protein